MYGYLSGTLNMPKISSREISKLKEIISFQQEKNKVELQTTTFDEDIENEYYKEFESSTDGFSNNDKYYNENLDLDQQDPSFYC
jgi:hypothetical protein